MEENSNIPMKRPVGRPRLSEAEKQRRAELRKSGELPTMIRPERREQVEPGDNARYLAHAMAVRNLPPIDHKDPAQVEERINWYLNHCISNDMKPTVTGFCNSIGVTRQTLYNWKAGLFRENTHEEIILKAYSLLEEMWENYMQNGKINPTAGVFLGVNNFGYRDVRQVDITPVIPADQNTVDVAAIEAKYDELPEGD